MSSQIASASKEIESSQSSCSESRCSEFDGTVDDIEITSRLLNIVMDMPVQQQLRLLKKLDASGFSGARRRPRTFLEIPWAVVIDQAAGQDDGQGHGSVITDISRCGVFIETPQSFSVGEKILLTFEVPTNRKEYKITGEIVRIHQNGIGVKFKHLHNPPR